MFRHPYLQIALWGVCHGLLGPEGCLKMSHFGQLRDLVLLVAKPPQNVPLIDFARKLSLEAECIMLDLAQNAGFEICGSNWLGSRSGSWIADPSRARSGKFLSYSSSSRS